MKIQLSRKEIADAILHNNETVTTGGDRMGVFVWANGRAEVCAVGRGTYYTGVDIYNPVGFVEIELSDDTTQWRNEAREVGVEEGRIRDVYPDELTSEEEELITEYADLYEQIWREEIRYKSVMQLEDMDGPAGSIEIEWTD